MKALTVSFQTVPVSSLEPFTIARYGLVLPETILKMVRFPRIAPYRLKPRFPAPPIPRNSVHLSNYSRPMSNGAGLVSGSVHHLEKRPRFIRPKLEGGNYSMILTNFQHLDPDNFLRGGIIRGGELNKNEQYSDKKGPYLR